MKVGDPVTVKITQDGVGVWKAFRQYELIKIQSTSNYSMVTEDAVPTSAGACTVSLRRLNTHKWNWVAKIQIRIFKRLLQEPKDSK